MKSNWKGKLYTLPNRRLGTASAIANSGSLLILSVVYGTVQVLGKDVPFGWFAGTYLVLKAIEYYIFLKWKEKANSMITKDEVIVKE